jgi:cytoskeleton protein RodZ
MTPQDQQQAHLVDPDAAPVGTARVGAELRAVREQVGWKLPDVAAELRIRQPYLEAIERGDLEALPGPAYQTGFIRTYAQTLGLDGDEILRRFRAEGAGFVAKSELSFLAPVPDRAVPTGAIVLVGVVVLLVGYGFWFLHTENERNLAAEIPSVPAQLAPLAVPTAPPPSVAQTSVVKAPAVPQPSVTPPQVVQNTATAPAAPVAPNPTAPALPPATPTAPSAATTTAVPPAASVSTAASAPVLGPVTGKTITATGDSWVEVRDALGNILFSRVLHAGESWPVPDMPGLMMTTGNAGGTEIATGGTPGQALGSAGTVLRNYALTPPSASVGPSVSTGPATSSGPSATPQPTSLASPAGNIQ